MSRGRPIDWPVNLDDGKLHWRSAPCNPELKVYARWLNGDKTELTVKELKRVTNNVL
jgi:hypothetical protein